MERGRVVLVRCVFLRGAFPHERAFVIRFDDGMEYRGFAPERYCRAVDRQGSVAIPAPDSEVDGFIFGIQVARVEGGIWRTQLPDGNIYELSGEPAPGHHGLVA